MTEKEVRALCQTNPLPEKWKGKKKVHEHVYCSLYGSPTKEGARRKLKRAKRDRPEREGFYCPGGNHQGIYKANGKWYAYLHFARYE